MSDFKTIRVGKNVAYLYGGKTGKYFALYHKDEKLPFDHNARNYTKDEIVHLLSLDFGLKLVGYARENNTRPIRKYQAVIQFDNFGPIKGLHSTLALAKKHCYKYAKADCYMRYVRNAETGEVLWYKLTKN